MCILDTEVVCQLIVVMSANNFCLDDFRDVSEALVVQHAVDVVPLFQVFRFGLSGLFVFGLQFSQPQPHTTNADSIRSFSRQLASERVLELPQLGYHEHSTDENLVQVLWEGG